MTRIDRLARSIKDLQDIVHTLGDEPIRLLLMFLTPLTGTAPITLREGR